MRTTLGSPLQFGATFQGRSKWNFAVFSTEKVTHLAIADFDTEKEIATFPLHKDTNRTGSIWHISVSSLPKRFYWGWRVEKGGTNQFATDPYATLLHTGSIWGKNRWHSKNTFVAVASEPVPFEWSSTSMKPCAPHNHIIYETHVRSMTRDPSSKVQYPGTWSGLREKVDYFSSLGVTAVELLPIYEFNEMDWPRINPTSGELLYNYWGYSPMNFFAPMQRYSSCEDPIDAANELKKTIDIFHQNNIQVILDVVYNHTGEGNEKGPAFSWKLLSEPSYYILDHNGQHTNYSGCGNTFNINQAMSRKMILDSLNHWVREYHIDGFRFDLAGIFERGPQGEKLSFSPLLQDISLDPILSKKLLILEPWDAADMYKTGSLFRNSESTPFFEWNDRYRDDVRRFIRGDENQKGLFATRLSGSEDMYTNSSNHLRTMNYITSHDGFSLRDLVSYNVKHNLDNAELNRDGTTENFSWNCGEEGPTDDESVYTLREKQIRNFILALFLSRGIIMLTQGDEYGHTKNGNNNSWCHDDRTNWFQWDTLEHNNPLFTYVHTCLLLRKKLDVFRSESFFTQSDIDWHGTEPFFPEWSTNDPYLGFSLKTKKGIPEVYVGFSPSKECTIVTLPSISSSQWSLLLWSGEKPLMGEKTSPFQKIYVPPFSSFVCYSKN